MREKILVADDDRSVRTMVARVLELAGYTPVLTTNGPEALLSFAAAKPSVILLDLKLPGRKGWEIFEQLKRLNPQVAIIAITAWDNQRQEAVQQEVDELMEKPLDLALLLKTIAGLLEQTEPDRTGQLVERLASRSELQAGSKK